MLYDINNSDLEPVFKKEFNHYIKDSYNDKIYFCFLKYILEYRFIRDLIDETPQEIITDILSCNTLSNTYMYPCDIVELRMLLSEKSIYHNNIALFSPKIFRKYLNRYPLSIYIDIDKIKKCENDFNGMKTYGNKLFLNENDKCSITNIVVKEPISKEQRLIISNLLLEFNVHDNISFENSIPGVSSYNPKLAQDITQHYVYRQVNDLPVNTPSGNPLGLNKGDRVRWRNRGLLLNQYYGRVTEINQKNIIIAWDIPDGKNVITKFPSQDPILIWKYISKV